MDWKNIIFDISRNGGLTQSQIAEKCHCAQTTISDIANGRTGQPNYSLGQALLTLHKKHRKPKEVA